MKTKYTEGKWNYKMNGFGISIGNEDTGMTKNGHDYTVCIIDDNSNQATANAKLIAAAPDLLTALIRCEKQLALAQKRISLNKADDMKAQQYAWARGDAQLAIAKALA